PGCGRARRRRCPSGRVARRGSRRSPRDYVRGVTQYGALIRTPRMARLYAAMILARLSIGIDGIATVLFLRHEGKSFAVAGAAAGALALGAALGAPFAARLIDRLSARVVLAWLAIGHAAGLM